MCPTCGTVRSTTGPFCSECGTAFARACPSCGADDVCDLLSQYFDTARTLIERYGGVVEKFIGDAVMAVWGVPTAHEDDCERAVRAALDLVDAVSSLGDEVAVPGLA